MRYKLLNIRNISIVYIFATITTPSLAQGEPINRNFYVIGELGTSSMASGPVSPYRFQSIVRFGYRASMGYLFSFNSYLSAGPEVGYGYYGKVSYLNPSNLVARYELTGWDVLANFRYKPAKIFNIYVKPGIAELSQQLKIIGPGATPGGFYQQSLKPILVVGGSYNLTNSAELSLTYTHIFANPAPVTSNPEFTFTNVNQISSVNAIMLGVVYSI